MNVSFLSRTGVFGLALVMGCVLLAAAIGKFFFPTEYLKDLDRWVSGFEVVLIAGLFAFRRQAWMWMAAAAIFASWGGYAFFWCSVELPCSCMGEMLKVPTLVSLSVDILFFGLSLGAAFLLGAGRQGIFLVVLSGMLLSLGGYAFGEWIYQNRVLANQELMAQFEDDDE